MMTLIRRAFVYLWHALVCMIVFALILFVFWAASYVHSVQQRRRVQRLLDQLAMLQLGTTDDRATDKIAQDFGGKKHCIGDLCDYDFDYAFTGFSSGWLSPLRRTEWDRVALRPWRVFARIETKDAQLTDVEFTTAVGRGKGWLFNQGPLSGNMWATLMISVTNNAARFEQRLGLEANDRTRNQAEAGNKGIVLIKPSFDTPGGGEALEVYLAPGASSESRRIAFDVNLLCTTAAVSCINLCQLAPSAWRSYLQANEPNAAREDCSAAVQQ
jgi:hypothetical protein